MFLKKSLPVIGSTELITVAGIKGVPAKIDTGADTSAIHASSLDMKKDGTLVFTLFDKHSPFFTGERLTTKDYMAKVVRSAHGDEQIRYRVRLPVKIAGKSFETTFTLANRARNNFPILVGRRTLDGNFLVDVSKSAVSRPKNPHTPSLNRELKENPYEFHQKYVK